MSRIVETIETAVDVIERLQSAGYQAVFAGGCVRDFILSMNGSPVEPKDIDIATSATPEQVESLFEKTVAVGKSFGVIRVIHDGEEFEVATFRKDSGTSDGRRPDSVEFSSMEQDALRRDLTINAIFYDPIAEKFHDFVGGQDDIKHRSIRFVGNPFERIEEDKLRILRVIRFVSRGGWVVQSQTRSAVVSHAADIKVVSAERIVDELTKIFTHSRAVDGYRNIKAYGLWEHIFPDVSWDEMCEDAFKAVPTEGNKALAWAIVLAGADHPADWMRRYKFDGDTMDEVNDILTRAQMYRSAREMKGSARMRLIANKYFDNHILFACAFGSADIAQYLENIKKSTPVTQIHVEKLVDGHDLINMGMKPGKEMKAILETIADEQREGRITTSQQAFDKAAELITAQKS